jgi:hypothetical protein
VNPSLHEVAFEGGLLARGFWLYVWEITITNGRHVYYVGCTGDKSSGVCQSPFDRFSKHLGANVNNNALQRHLTRNKLNREACSFRFYAFGPLLVGRRLSHDRKCDRVAALEKALANSMRASGYDVLNQVNCRLVLDQALWRQVSPEFKKVFPKLM